MDKLNHIFKSRYIISNTSTRDIPDLPGVVLHEIHDHFYGLNLGNLNPARIEYWANRIINHYKENEEFTTTFIDIGDKIGVSKKTLKWEFLVRKCLWKDY